jgi:hypothetical protein
MRRYAAGGRARGTYGSARAHRSELSTLSLRTRVLARPGKKESKHARHRMLSLVSRPSFAYPRLSSRVRPLVARVLRASRGDHSAACLSCVLRSRFSSCAISGTSGSSGFGSVKSEQIDSSTARQTHTGDGGQCATSQHRRLHSEHAFGVQMHIRTRLHISRSHCSHVQCSRTPRSCRRTLRDGERRRPRVLQNVEADAALVVDIAMVYLGRELHLWRLERVVRRELDLETEHAARVRAPVLREGESRQSGSSTRMCERAATPFGARQQMLNASVQLHDRMLASCPLRRRCDLGSSRGRHRTGPMMDAFHSKRSSPAGPALQLAGGSRPMSFSSCTERRCEAERAREARVESEPETRLTGQRPSTSRAYKHIRDTHQHTYADTECTRGVQH